jgi:hypothetical protein
MNESGGWYEYPAALVSQGRVVGWVCDERQARLIVNLYQLRGDPLAQAGRLLACLSTPEAPTDASTPHFEVEAPGPLLLPGHPVALKWDGEVIAWLRQESLGWTLASVLNAFIKAYHSQRSACGIDDRVALL